MLGTVSIAGLIELKAVFDLSHSIIDLAGRDGTHTPVTLADYPNQSEIDSPSFSREKNDGCSGTRGFCGVRVRRRARRASHQAIPGSYRLHEVRREGLVGVEQDLLLPMRMVTSQGRRQRKRPDEEIL